ncbi:MAG: hypothetical protein ACOCRK_06360 [bacterium]
MEEIKPERGYTLIRKEKKEKLKETKSGIVVPQKEKDRDEALVGEVIKVGKGRKNNKGVEKKPEIESGDSVFFKQYAGHKVGEEEIMDKEYEYFIIKHHDIIAVIE